MTTVEMLLRLGAGVGLGTVIGFERQYRARMAGLRTNALVAVGATLFVLLSAHGFGGLSDTGSADPTRVAAQIVSGIGFLGAGVILRDGMTVRGLNTAATLWCSAAVGALSGAGLYPVAAAGTAVVVLVNLALRPLGRAIDRRPESGDETPTVYSFHAVTRDDAEAHVRALLVQALGRTDFRLASVRSANTDTDGYVEVRPTWPPTTVTTPRWSRRSAGCRWSPRSPVSGGTCGPRPGTPAPRADPARRRRKETVVVLRVFPSREALARPRQGLVDVAVLAGAAALLYALVRVSHGIDVPFDPATARHASRPTRPSCPTTPPARCCGCSPRSCCRCCSPSSTPPPRPGCRARRRCSCQRSTSCSRCRSWGSCRSRSPASSPCFPARSWAWSARRSLRSSPRRPGTWRSPSTGRWCPSPVSWTRRHGCCGCRSGSGSGGSTCPAG